MGRIDFRKKSTNSIIINRKRHYRKGVLIFSGFLLVAISLFLILTRKHDAKSSESKDAGELLANKAPEPNAFSAQALQQNITRNLLRLTPADKARITDCAEGGGPAVSTQNPLTQDQLGYFSARASGKSQFYLAENRQWPFVFGIHNSQNFDSAKHIFVVMRGEASGFHKSSMTPGLIRWISELNNNLFLTLDEYAFFPETDGKPDIRKSPLMPLCHRRVFPSGYIGPFIPAFRFGGAWQLLEQVTGHADNLVLLMYSNSTSPRSEFFKRKVKDGSVIDFNKAVASEQYLKEYISSTENTDTRYQRISGIIDIEGNFEKGQPLWDLLGFLKENVMQNSKKFYYSAVRIDKSDAYPVQVQMVRALRLQGSEDEDGVVTFTNKLKNVIIEFITNDYQPHYINVGVDLRTVPGFTPAPAELTITRQQLSHFTIPTWAFNRIRKKYPHLVGFKIS